MNSGRAHSVACMTSVPTTDGTGSHVTQRPSDPGIQRPGDPVDPETLFYNELQMSICVKKYSQAKEFLIIISWTDIQWFQSNNRHLTMTFVISAFQIYVLHFGHFFRKPEKLGSHTGSKWWPGDPDVKDDPHDLLTRWPNDPVRCLVPTASALCCEMSWRASTARWWISMK